MAEKRGIKRVLARMGTALLALTAGVLVYLAAVLLQSPAQHGQDAFIVEEAPQAVTRMQSATMMDASALARMFESRLPVLNGLTPEGKAVNTSYDGGVARLVTLRYNGVTLAAVQPAAAAPLLLHGELDVQLRSDLTVLGLPAVLASKGSAHCLYFSDEAASYTVYAPEADEKTFLSLIPRLSWVNPEDT